nr:glycogenin-1-like [Lytechinus pictus]
MVQSAVIQVSEARQHNALTKKTSLSLWTRTPKPKAKDLYPGHISNPSLRSAITIRAQISCQVYLTQVRLAKIGKAPDDCCRLCMSACEDVEHLVATCPALAPVRQDLIQRVKANLNTKQFGPCFESTPALFLSSLANAVEDQAFVTLVTNDRYAYGALVVGQSLRDVGTTRQLAILITPEVTQPMRRQLSMLYDYIQEVNPLDSQDDAHLALLTRPDLGITFTKLYSWRLTRYSKCVFLDADTLVLQNVDDLFDREELSAAPDVGWPDCFNSGVFVFKPSNETYRGLLQCAVTQGSFDGGDQGLLNTFFSDWATADINKHLPFIYNMTSAISYSYLPAFVRFGNEVRIVHFIGRTKPWMYRYNTHTGTITRPSDVDVTHDSIYVKIWWDVFMSKVKPRVEQEQASNTSQYSVSGTEGRTNQAQGQDEVMTAPPVVDTRPQGQSQTQSVHCNVPDDNDVSN